MSNCELSGGGVGGGVVFSAWLAGAELVIGGGGGGAAYRLTRRSPCGRFELMVSGLSVPRLAGWCGAGGAVDSARYVPVVVRDVLGAVRGVVVPVRAWGAFVGALAEGTAGVGALEALDALEALWGVEEAGEGGCAP